MKLKFCIRCSKDKDINLFNLDATRQDGRYPYCKDCTRKIKSTEKARKRDNEYRNEVRRENPELRQQRVMKERERRYKRLYGITVEEYDKLLEYQNGVCAICGNPPKTRRLSVDHDHKTGNIRGLLCHLCNQTLHGRVNIDWLHNAYEYLDVSPVFDALGYIPKGKIGSIKKRKKKK